MTRRAYLYFVLTFLLGVTVGGAGTLYYGWYFGHWRHEFNPRRVVMHMKRDLDLSETQVQQVDEIIEDSRKKFGALQQQEAPQFQAIREETRERIRKILNPQQLANFNERVRSFDERAKRQPLPPPPH